MAELRRAVMSMYLYWGKKPKILSLVVLAERVLVWRGGRNAPPRLRLYSGRRFLDQDHWCTRHSDAQYTGHRSVGCSREAAWGSLVFVSLAEVGWVSFRKQDSGEGFAVFPEIVFSQGKLSSFPHTEMKVIKNQSDRDSHKSPHPSSPIGAKWGPCGSRSPQLGQERSLQAWPQASFRTLGRLHKLLMVQFLHNQKGSALHIC